ncbi:MAG: T9SS type A sorting domain-containing protein [Chitinophagaceae bacterium]|nr:MAG: T9SS type A sorting domain-containing protein [Chitinophagaceae bacterium]
MNRFSLRLTLLFLLIAQLVLGQAGYLQLKTGRQEVPALSRALVDSFNRTLPRAAGRGYLVLQFEQLPTQANRKMLQAAGVELLQYVPDGGYTASLRMPFSEASLRQAGVRGILALEARQKLDPLLADGLVPAWAVKVRGTVNVLIRITDAVLMDIALSELQARAFYLTNRDWEKYRVVGVQVPVARLQELALLPIVDYVQAEQPVTPLNFNTRSSTRANLLNAPLTQGGRALNGEGVVLGIGDDADVQTHVDFTNRLINRSVQTQTSHGYHTTGTLAGAGIVNELYRGLAPKATIVSSIYSGILFNAATYYNDFGMVLTNNSYGNIAECSYMGLYDIYAQALDQQAYDLPELTHVFSAGNSGASTCAPFPQRYHTVFGGYQSAKNVVTVGATTDSGLVSSFSSRGPVRDGRIKPEVVAQGQSVISAVANNTYGSNQGTSMSAPAVTAGMGLLVQSYRALHGNANPQGALMKALLCNGSTDRGTDGPDFNYGFGWMNLLRSVDMLESNRYLADAATQGSTNTHNISVPAGTAQLKVLLYWHDPAASLIASKTLVNDLDLEVVDLGNNTLLPYRLDTSMGALGSAAFASPDHLNNIEQVVITAPPAGTYAVRVKGTTIAQNPTQPYFLVWDPIPVSLQLTNPVGGEGWVPGDIVKLNWECYGSAGSTFTLEYSINNGSSWNTIATGIDSARRIYTWTVPSVATAQAKVRITQLGTGATSTSNAFVIADLPVLTMAATANQCEGYINFSWTSISGATDYEVMMLRGDEMVSMATTTATSHVLSGLSSDSTFWVAVRPRISGQPGRRSVALSRQPNTGTCSGTLSNGDLKLSSITGPVSRRLNTSNALTATTTLSVRVKNLDDAAITGFDMKYSVNGGAWVTEAVNATVNAGATYSYNFATKINMLAAGSYNVRAVVKNWASDPVAANDTFTATIKQLQNSVLTLPFTDDFETLTNTTYSRDQTGLDGNDHFDFTRNSGLARLRTVANSNFPGSGNRAVTLDMVRYNGSNTTNYLTGTFNLSSFTALTQDLRLGFTYRDHGQGANAANKVWIRGSDTSAWLEAYDLVTNSNGAGSRNVVRSIELSRLLNVAGQKFSSSFQVRWGQYGVYPAVDLYGGNGYTFDDVRIYDANNDLQVQSILSPAPNACGLGSSVSISARIRNSSFNTITNIPFRYRIDGGSWITEIFPSLAADDSVDYVFSTPADISSFGTHTVQVLVDFPADNLRDDDTLSLTLQNVPVVSTFPYLQNFESGPAYWYTGGKNSSWQHGMPSSSRISRAASGSKAWKTRLDGNYNDREYSYLYSPCFNVSAMTAPALSFSMAMDLEDCGANTCDAAWVEYSTNGSTWSKLGLYNGTGTNWYNKNTDVWSRQSYTTWRVATYALPAGASELRLRIVMSSDESTSREGIAIDDVHVYDDAGLFTGPTSGLSVTQNVQGSSWVDFSSGGKLLASIKPNGDSLGNTDVQVYIDTVPHYTSNQYYLGRSFTIKPANRNLADSVTVRLYFSELESEMLLSATGCTYCAKPASAFDLGVSKYTDAHLANEDNSLANNSGGSWKFYGGGARTIVPYDKGYYVEFKVKNFSEFWFNSGGVQGASLPVRFVSFDAHRAGEAARLNWELGMEDNVLRYDVEVAEGDEALRRGQFVTIGSVTSPGNTTSSRRYQYLDGRPGKTGTYYYRLRVRNADGSFQFSAVRPVLFSELFTWSVYPNPSVAVFYLTLRAEAGASLRFRLFDGQGRSLRHWKRSATGFIEKEIINLDGLPAGVYLLQADEGSGPQSFRLYKQ